MRNRRQQDNDWKEEQWKAERQGEKMWNTERRREKKKKEGEELGRE